MKTNWHIFFYSFIICLCFVSCEKEEDEDPNYPRITLIE